MNHNFNQYNNTIQVFNQIKLNLELETQNNSILSPSPPLKLKKQDYTYMAHLLINLHALEKVMSYQDLVPMDLEAPLKLIRREEHPKTNQINFKIFK